MIQEKTLTTLEYDKIKNIMTQHLACEVGLEFAKKLPPCGYAERCRNPAEQTSEAESIYTRTAERP
jgi:dsDNA-specific endonuclease/ATPase MutS2